MLISDLDHPFGLALHGDYIYWTDWLSESIQRVNKITGEGRITIVDYVEKPMDIQAVSRNLTTPGIIITVISVALFELLVTPSKMHSWINLGLIFLYSVHLTTANLSSEEKNSILTVLNDKRTSSPASNMQLLVSQCRLDSSFH